MADTKLRFTPLKNDDDFRERFLSRAEVGWRWGCSEKAVLRAEKRLGLQPYRLLRAIKYKLSDVKRAEAEAGMKLPKKFTGLRPDQKAELLRREREEVAKPPEGRRGASVSKHTFQPQP
jgi:hypothetical protein